MSPEPGGTPGALREPNDENALVAGSCLVYVWLMSRTPPENHEYADALPNGLSRGRGAGLNPGNRFDGIRLHMLGDHLDAERDAEIRGETGRDNPPAAGVESTNVLVDRTQRVINRIDVPDLPFHWSVNPYRGCEHGCVYCYARPTHEMLGLSCGLDFETRIMAKPDAPRLLRKELAAPRWKGEPILMCGVTDGYQPVESKLRITRGCLEVMAACRQPVSIVTKSRLITRDIDLLSELASHHAARVAISLTTLDKALASKMEPRASSPKDRLRAIEELASAGVPVMAMIAPVIPGLTDREMPSLIEAAASAGASFAGWIMLRLPHQVKALFIEWLERHYPDRTSRIENQVRGMHDGKLYEPKFGQRFRGTGPMADQIAKTFDVFTRRVGLDRDLPPLNATAFRKPELGGQLSLFQ